MSEEIDMLLFQILVFLFVISYGKKSRWTKYLLIANVSGWYIWLQKNLQIPGTVGILLLELAVIFVTDVYYIWINLRQKKIKNLVKENGWLQDQICRYKSQIEQNKTYQERVYQIKHDLKNKFLGLEALLVGKKYEEIKWIIDDTLEELCIKTCIQTGNVMLDNLINCKIAYAKEKQISVDIEARIPVEDRLDTMSLVIAIGNLLDNAIEACENIPKDRRYIKIKIMQKDTRIFIEIENSFSGEIKTDKKGELITSKKYGDFHGYGVKSVKKALDNIGDFIYYIEDKKFCATVILY